MAMDAWMEGLTAGEVEKRKCGKVKQRGCIAENV